MFARAKRQSGNQAIRDRVRFHSSRAKKKEEKMCVDRESNPVPYNCRIFFPIQYPSSPAGAAEISCIQSSSSPWRYWMGTGWVLDGYWMGTGWVLDGYWMSTGWVLDGYWMGF